MKVEIYSTPQCPFCVQAKALAEREGHELTYKMLDEDFNREELMETFPVQNIPLLLTVEDSVLHSSKHL